MNTWMRWRQHLGQSRHSAHQALPAAARQRLEQAVVASEVRHSGELRLCVEGRLPWRWLMQGVTARTRAVSLFSQLQVWDTAHNNGVLIYLLLAERRIEIVADRGLNEHMTTAEWASISEQLAHHLQTGHFEAGLSEAIHQIGERLRQHFPHDAQQSRPNELPDAVVLL